MNLIVVASSTSAHLVGGVETHVERLAGAATALGHAVTIVTTAHPDGRSDEDRDGVRIEYLPGTPPAVPGRAWRRESAFAVQRLLARRFGDLALSFNFSGLGLAGTALGVPHYVFSSGAMPHHLISEWHECAGPAGGLTFARRALGILYHAAVERRLWARVDGVIATFDGLERELERRGVPCVLAYTGTDLGLFRPDPRARAALRSALGVADTDEVLLMAGTVNRQKGVWLGLDAFLRLAATRPALHLVVVGDGPDRVRLEARARQRRDGARVRFLGTVSPAAMPGYFAAADVLLVPTFRAEGLPNVVVEAAATGVPVVATGRGGIPIVVRHGETGLLLDPLDVETLAAAIRRLLDGPEERRAMGRRGTALAQERFDARKTVARLLSALADLEPRRPLVRG